MVEQVMFFALGFFVAGFFAVLLAPALNHRAERLANRRMRALFPVSLEEMTAERDHLRAEFAVTTRAMERKQQRMFEEKAAALGEAGKQLSSVGGMKRQLDDANAERAALEAARAGLQADLETTRQQRDAAVVERDAARPELAALTSQRAGWNQEQAAMTRRVDDQRIAIAEMESRIAAISAAALESSNSEKRLTDELRDERSAMRVLQQTLASQRTHTVRATERMTAREQGRDAAHEAEIRNLRERLAQSQEHNDTRRMTTNAAPAATASRSVPATCIAPRAAADVDVRAAIAVLQNGLADFSPDHATAASALRHRIVDVARSIMAESHTEPAAVTMPPAALLAAAPPAIAASSEAPAGKPTRKPATPRTVRSMQKSAQKTLR